MSLALLVAGIATAAIALLALAHIRRSDDPVDSIADADGVANEEDGITGGVVYEIPSNASETVLTTFNPSKDRLSLSIDDWETEFLVETAEDGSVGLRYTAAGGTASIQFPTLSDFPFDAIEVAVRAEDDETATVFKLADIFAQVDEERGTDVEPIDPETQDGSLDPGGTEPGLSDVASEDRLRVAHAPETADTVNPVGADVPQSLLSVFLERPVVIDDLGEAESIRIELFDDAVPGAHDLRMAAGASGETTDIFLGDRLLASVNGTDPSLVERIELVVVPRDQAA